MALQLVARTPFRLRAPLMQACRIQRQHTLHGPQPPLANSPPIVKPTVPSTNAAAHAPQTAGPKPPPPTPVRQKPTLKGTKAALTLVSSCYSPLLFEYRVDVGVHWQSTDAVRRLQQLLSGPTPQLIRIGVRNKGCAGMSYHLEYVEKPGRFDEVVEQDGVKVFIDSKALFSIIGSEMHWQEDRMRWVPT